MNGINFISRELVIAILKECGTHEALKRVEALFSFPALNPKGEGGRNILGQTEDEFWDAVERQS